jgi:hypothetical protein
MGKIRVPKRSNTRDTDDDEMYSEPESASEVEAEDELIEVISDLEEPGKCTGRYVASRYRYLLRHSCQ